MIGLAEAWLSIFTCRSELAREHQVAANRSIREQARSYRRCSRRGHRFCNDQVLKLTDTGISFFTALINSSSLNLR